MTKTELKVPLTVPSSSLVEAMKWAEIRKSLVEGMTSPKDIEDLMIQCVRRLVYLYTKDHKLYQEKEILSTFGQAYTDTIMRTFRTRCRNSLNKSRGYRKVLKVLRLLSRGGPKEIEQMSKLRI